MELKVPNPIIVKYWCYQNKLFNSYHLHPCMFIKCSHIKGKLSCNNTNCLSKYNKNLILVTGASVTRLKRVIDAST